MNKKQNQKYKVYNFSASPLPVNYHFKNKNQTQTQNYKVYNFSASLPVNYHFKNKNQNQKI
jgi:hypothetical protein